MTLPRIQNPKSNIYTLMQDMADALSDPNMNMLGGGSPAMIEEAVAIFQKSMITLAENKDMFMESVCQYSESAGDVVFREQFADYLSRKQNWQVSKDNILVTGGSQSAFKILFEHFTINGKKIVFPIIPDYIGYGILSPDDMFGVMAEIELIDDMQFRYRIASNLDDYLDDAGCLCISRPCNPTGGMIGDDDLVNLLHLADKRGLSVILDNAYGQPIPNIVYSQRILPWADNAIYCLSLSKLGLPGVRTGMVVADSKIITALAEINAKHALAPGGVGPAMARVLLQSGQLERLTESVILPWYQYRTKQVVLYFERYFRDLPVRYHQVDGGFFNWIYCEDLPINGHQLYELFKQNQLIVVPGYAFAPGLKTPWAHLEQCFRISTGQPLERVKKGIETIAQVLHQVYQT